MKAKQTDSINQLATPATPTIPDIPGIKKMSTLDMNAVRFDKRHTVLTPELLSSMAKQPPQKE